jgi:hypothetical protein
MSETEMQAAAPVAPAAEKPAEVAEPVSSEPIEAAADAAFVSVGAPVVGVLGFCALTLFIVATPIAWFTRNNMASSSSVGLFSLKDHSGTSGDTLFVGQIVCDEVRKRLRAVSAFAVISILLAAGLTVAAIAARLGKATMGAVSGVAFATFASSLVCWAMGLRVYYQSGLYTTVSSTACTSTSFSQQKYEIGAGEALFITGWTLSALACLVAKLDPKVPAIVPDAVLDKVGALLFAAFSFVAFVFVVVGTPQDIVYWWIDEATVLRATMWQVVQNVYSPAGVAKTTFTFAEFSKAFNCGTIYRYAKFAEAFAIIAIAFMLFAFVAGLLFSGGKIGKGAPIVLGLLATVTALISAAACATIYYREFCNGLGLSLNGASFQLASGVALFVAAVLVEAVATIVLIVIALVQHLKGGAKGGNVKPTAFLLLFGLFVSVFFLVLGASQPLFTKNVSAATYTKVTWWTQVVKAGGSVTEEAFGCKEISQRLVGGGALVIISIFFSTVGLLLGVVQLVSAGLRTAASVAGLVSSVTQLVAWGLAVTVFTGSFCGNQFYTTGYKIEVGLGLVIASWCLTTLVSVLNLLVAPADE